MSSDRVFGTAAFSVGVGPCFHQRYATDSPTTPAIVARSKKSILVIFWEKALQSDFRGKSLPNRMDLVKISRLSLLLLSAPFLVLNPLTYCFLGLWAGCHILSFGTDDDPKNWIGLTDSAKINVSAFVLRLIPNKLISDWKKTSLYGAIQSVQTGQIESTQKNLFVSNHQIWGLDTLFIICAIYNQTGIWPRLLFDSCAIVPIIRHITCRLGAFHPKHLELALEEGLPVLIFPGGINESMRSKHFKSNHCIWENRIDFCKLAKQFGIDFGFISLGYTLVPVASIGFEENVWRIFDIPGRFLFYSQSKYVSFPIILPKPNQRAYFYIGIGIDTSAYGKEDSQTFLLRDNVKKSIREGIIRCKESRHEDPFLFYWLVFLGWSERTL